MIFVFIINYTVNSFVNAAKFIHFQMNSAVSSSTENSSVEFSVDLVDLERKKLLEEVIKKCTF